MLIQQINRLKQRIQHLERSGKENSPKAIEAFRKRLGRMNARLEQLPVAQRLATSQILYQELEEVLLRFELLESISEGRTNATASNASTRWN